MAAPVPGLGITVPVFMPVVVTAIVALMPCFASYTLASAFAIQSGG
jgi:uncharacterized membrane protein